MKKMTTALKCFWDDERGVSSMEYALIGGLIAVVIVAAVTSVGQNVAVLYNNVATQIANAV